MTLTISYFIDALNLENANSAITLEGDRSSVEKSVNFGMALPQSEVVAVDLAEFLLQNFVILIWSFDHAVLSFVILLQSFVILIWSFVILIWNFMLLVQNFVILIWNFDNAVLSFVILVQNFIILISNLVVTALSFVMQVWALLNAGDGPFSTQMSASLAMSAIAPKSG